MAVFQAALVNELEKLYRKKKVMVAILLSIGIVGVGEIAQVLLRNNFGLRGTGSMEFPIFILSVVVNTVLPLFTTLVAIEIFAGEFSQNVMRITLTRPVSRIKVFSAKITTIAIFILINLVLLLLFSLLAGMLFSSNSFTLGSIFSVLWAYIISFVPLLVLALGIVILANILKSGVAVFFTSILAFLGLKVLGMTFAKYSSLFIVPLLSWYNVWLVDSLPIMRILLDLLALLGYGIILFTVGYYLFDKKEL